ncbi:MAG: hypothetical protein ABI780_00185 [Ardenticatenales bacterium]
MSAIAGACSAGPTIAPPTPEPTWDISVPYVKPTHLPPEVVSAPNQPLPPLTPVPPPSTLGRPRHDLGPPASQPAEIGRTYAFATDHCGLDDSVDFDGSYWTVSAMSDDPKSVSVNSAIGTITLESHDVALFRSGAFAARLARLTGTVWGRTCM